MDEWMNGKLRPDLVPLDRLGDLDVGEGAVLLLLLDVLRQIYTWKVK